MADWGIKLSLPGQDVLVAKDPKNFILNSKFNTLKIWKYVRGGFNVPLNGTASYIFHHGFGYQPGVLAFYKLKSGIGSSWWCDGVAMDGNEDREQGMHPITYITSSTIKFEVTSTFTADNVEYAAFIFTDPIQNVSSSVIGAPYTTNYGLKISQPSYDVQVAKPHELEFSSNYPCLNFHMDKTLSITILADDTTGVAQFSHGLRYVPAFVAMITDPSDSTLHASVPRGRVPQPFVDGVHADRENIYVRTVKIITPGTDYTFSYRIIVFKNRISEQ